MDLLCVSRQRHLKNAAAVWFLVGLMLGVRGTIWVLGDPRTHRLVTFLLPLALLLGLIKGLVVLRKTALRGAERINSFSDCTPFWKLYSRATYLMIIGMMALGFLCRWAGAHWHAKGDVGVLYLIISAGLISGSTAYLSASADIKK